MEPVRDHESEREIGEATASVHFTNAGDVDHDEQKFQHITRQLYISHFLSTWNFRSFEFGAVLFLAHIYPSTLAPLSVYAVIRSLAPIILGSQVGRYVDEQPRLPVVRTSIIGQRGAVIISCMLFLLMIFFPDMPVLLNRILFVASILVACVEKLCAIMNTVSVERDWVVEIAEKSDNHLTRMNAQMRRIDLFCKLAGPLAIALIDGFSIVVAVVVLLGANLVSVVIEYVLIANVYRNVPALANAKISHVQHEPNGQESMVLSEIETNADGENIHRPSSHHPSMYRGVSTFWRHLETYISQSAFQPSLSLSILYLTVLSLGGQMVTYLLAAGYTSTMIGLIRVGSTVFELSATWMAPYALQKIGPVRSGIWFLSWQTSCLAIATVLFWQVSDPLWAATGLVGGTILSRVGLWGFDLSAQVIIQDEVDAHARGSFSTTEAALQNLFELTAYLSTIVFWHPSQFKYPVAISVAAVFVASAIYARFVRSRRGHLLHFSKCMEGRHRSQYHLVQFPGAVFTAHSDQSAVSSPTE